jgi:F420H(2)-dependent quinone reductase
MSSWTKWFTSLNVFVYKASRGRLGNRMGRQSVLLLNSVGRKSGKNYTTTLSYYNDGSNYLVVASNWGNETHPAWYLNLLAHPHTTIQIRSEVVEVDARTAHSDEYERLWKQIAEKNDQYIKYQTGLKRTIPIVVLTPSIPKR